MGRIDSMIKNIVVGLGVLLSFVTGVTAQTYSPQELIASMASAAGKASVIEGKNGWLFLKEELLHLSNTAYYGESLNSDPVPAIVDFNKQLQENNIDLLLVLIPPKALIYSDMLPGDFTQEMVSNLGNPYRNLYAKLNEEGVKILDLEETYRNTRTKAQVYCKTDSHFSGQGLEVAVNKIVAEITSKPWYAATSQVKFSTENIDIAITGDLAQMYGNGATEDLLLQFVTNSATGKAVAPDPDSPVLLLGDSHTLVFSVGGDLHTRGAGLFEHLSATLGFPVDRIGVRGSGATPSRIKLFQRSRKDSKFLSNKKMVIWCLSGRELTGAGGWRKIPLAKK